MLHAGGAAGAAAGARQRDCDLPDGGARSRTGAPPHTHPPARPARGPTPRHLQAAHAAVVRFLSYIGLHVLSGNTVSCLSCLHVDFTMTQSYGRELHVKIILTRFHGSELHATPALCTKKLALSLAGLTPSGCACCRVTENGGRLWHNELMANLQHTETARQNMRTYALALLGALKQAQMRRALYHEIFPRPTNSDSRMLRVCFNVQTEGTVLDPCLLWLLMHCLVKSGLICMRRLTWQACPFQPSARAAMATRLPAGRPQCSTSKQPWLPWCKILA